MGTVSGATACVDAAIVAAVVDGRAVSTVFAGVSVVVMVLVRPFAVKVLDKSRAKTNIDELPGQKAEVIETIDNAKGSGTVRLRGVEWMARSVDDTVIEEGKVVTIQSVSGVKLLVKE